MDINSFGKYLASGGLTPAMDGDDSAIGNTVPDLDKHDRRFHPQGFDPTKETCKFRETMGKTDNADDLSRAEGEEAANQNEAQEVNDIRDRLEPIARLLNGRAGNMQALQASRRWSALQDFPSSSVPQDLARLAQSSDATIAAAANDLKKVSDAILKSSQNGWNDPAGMVPPPSAMPQVQGGATPASTPAAATPTAGFSDDDAKGLLLRAAKSVNHHIDKGDNTPNPKAIARLHAAEQDIRNLGDKQLEGLMDDIFASEKAGFTQKIGNVPAPSAAWQQAHSPQLPAGLMGLLGGLFGGVGGMGGGAPAQQAPATTKKNPWVPFQAPSKYANALNSINAGHPAATDPDYWKNKADAMTPQQAVQDMEAKGSIVKGGYHDTFDANDPDENELWAGWNPSTKLSADTARCAAVCFDDLRSRFPNMPWKANLELRCGTKPGTGGQSTHTQDWRRHTVLFNCDYGNIWPNTGLGKGNFGHVDSRFPYDVLRHEMGHALISGMLPNGKRMISKWHDAMSAAFGNPAKDLETFAGTYVSSYAVTNKGHGFSMAECLSECFSLATSPDYKPGFLPPSVEEFIFGEMLGVKVP